MDFKQEDQDKTVQERMAEGELVKERIDDEGSRRCASGLFSITPTDTLD